MHRTHLIPCLVMLGAAVVVALAWGVQLGTLALVGAMLLCPLAMLVMMRPRSGAGHNHGRDTRSTQGSAGARDGR